MQTIGDSAAPYRTPAERRAVVVRRFRADGDCWFASAHPDTGPHIVPLSFLAAGPTVVLATAEHRPVVRNVRAVPRAVIALGGYGDAIRAWGTCDVTRFASLEPALRATYTAHAGWDPGSQRLPFVALLLRLEEVWCSRSPVEDEDRVVWRRGDATPW